MGIGLFSFDHGPRAVMSVLSNNADYNFINIGEDIKNYIGIVVSTSGSDKGVELEHQVRVEAKALNIPLIVIEDFPGNYQEKNNDIPDLIIVEHDDCRKLMANYVDISNRYIKIIPNPRYDTYRTFYRQNKHKFVLQKINNPAYSSVLWIGQPETNEAIDTLNIIAPVLIDLNLTLLFKAHPRDTGYKKNNYRYLVDLYGDLLIDVTNFRLDECVNMYEPGCVLTHYSSLAIDAGFHGVPAINVLISASLKERLFDEKGYRVPPWADKGGAMMVSNQEDLYSAVKMLVSDGDVRTEVNENFIKWFGQEPSTEKVVKSINDLCSKSIN